ncbi:MAG: hypothetical protein ACLQVY_12305 [Limisphaerales bacterium]
MEGARWIADNWLNLLNAVGVVGGLFFTATSIRSGAKAQKVANLLTVTSNHREIWKEFSRRPELARILDAPVDLSKQPVTLDEAEFVNLVILHLSSVYYAMKDGIVVKSEGLRRDVCSFFSLPIPGAVWEERKVFQNADFVKFVESCQD